MELILLPISLLKVSVADTGELCCAPPGPSPQSSLASLLVCVLGGGGAHTALRGVTQAAPGENIILKPF